MSANTSYHEGTLSQIKDYLSAHDLIDTPVRFKCISEREMFYLDMEGNLEIVVVITDQYIECETTVDELVNIPDVEHFRITHYKGVVDEQFTEAETIYYNHQTPDLSKDYEIRH